MQKENVERNISKVAALGQAGDSSLNISALVSGLVPENGDTLSTTVAELGRHLIELKSTSDAQTEAVGANTSAVSQNTVAQVNSAAKDVVSSIGRSAQGFLGGGLAVSPVVSLFGKLFGGGQPAAPQPLVKYALPASIRAEEVNVPPGRGAAPSYQLFDGAAGGIGPRSTETGTETANVAAPATRQIVVPPITIQVQAMDSRSFIDRSNDIAQAVREAMLNMHSLNDIINNL